jgi:hypothetical protein
MTKCLCVKTVSRLDGTFVQKPGGHLRKCARIYYIPEQLDFFLIVMQQSPTLLLEHKYACIYVHIYLFKLQLGLRCKKCLGFALGVPASTRLQAGTGEPVGAKCSNIINNGAIFFVVKAMFWRSYSYIFWRTGLSSSAKNVCTIDCYFGPLVSTLRPRVDFIKVGRTA